ncbi:52 kDa repressor of the inhibitor of the protein kinase-like [Diabrotica virgifera virgifera]|uniref:TTF-type domain-containing protein n=1 Tax=Diabrotica virgifera virgifera TaxID=50390 RepID=A0ABM5L613_DIAVI|nr:52 kDa repressor of the inhibitor of the protein kinase-like [Diabrotica virgifera virgifera]
MKRQLGLDSFFSKKIKAKVDQETVNEGLSNTNGSQTPISSISTASKPSQCGPKSDSSESELQIPPRDFGHLINKNETLIMSNNERYEWLTNPWTPSPEFKFPLNIEGKKNRSFQTSWLKQYPWLVYSKKLDGGLCKVCILFGRGEGGKSDGKLGKLVLEPMKTFKKATETLKIHNGTKYHNENMIASKHFSLVMDGERADIVCSLNSAQKAVEEENKKKLIPIIKTIMFCGMQNIPLRGHRDDGQLLNETDSEPHREGNFRALLRFRIDAGDKQLEEHVKSCGKNASYISKTIQNDLISCCGEVITNQIVSQITYAQFFTIIADETTDMSTKEQLSICLRYLDKLTLEIKEDFIMFIDVVDLTGENIAQKILEALDSLSINIADCRGQAYDGGSNMSGKFQGAQARIRKIQPLAMYSHCASHRLNLVISKACTIPAIRNAVGVVSSVANFFRESAKRLHALDDERNEEIKKGKHAVKKMCETRWLERHDAVLTFLSSLPSLHATLETMVYSDQAAGNNAFSLLHSILSSEFIVSLVVLENVMTLTLPLARKLQAEYMDVLNAMTLIDATLKSMQEQRANNEECFKRLFEKAQNLASKMETELKKPRLVGLQRNRPNVQTDTVEDYFRLSIYLPFLDFLVCEMKK